jgi:hypothetical protein
MAQAYDVKDLLEKLKAKGLPVVEETAKQVVVAVFEWLEESAVASATPIDNIAVPFYPMIKELALKEIDKIS